MTVSLSPEMQAFIAAKVRAGQFTSADEAVNRLLGELLERERSEGTKTRPSSNGRSFPVFEVPAGTPTFTGDDVRRAEDES
jgi:Arc/MetJ-type ribon-helix-helix transcriptional regulator